MITLESLPKTETYLGRKEYNEKFPDEKDHINLTKLIDSFIKVAIHMREALKQEPDLDFDSYVAINGINYFASNKREDKNNPLYAKGILQSEGGWKGRKLYPFFEWKDENKDSYGLRQGKVLKAIFDVLSKDKVDDTKIVSIVEDIDMWFNS
tara:strand:+ start:96 stop:551 length:456 start_codon:yes stop_codon:yes gene_type:complete